MCFFIELVPKSVPFCRSAKFCCDLPGDLNNMIFLTSCTQPFTTSINAGFQELLGFDSNLLMVEWELKDYDKIAG